MKYTLTIPAEAQKLIDQQVINEAEFDKACAILAPYPRSACGLTPDESKDHQWNEAMNLRWYWWDKIRDTNAALNKLRRVDHYEIIDGKRIPVYKYKIPALQDF